MQCKWNISKIQLCCCRWKDFRECKFRVYKVMNWNLLKLSVCVYGPCVAWACWARLPCTCTVEHHMDTEYRGALLPHDASDFASLLQHIHTCHMDTECRRASVLCAPSGCSQPWWQTRTHHRCRWRPRAGFPCGPWVHRAGTPRRGTGRTRSGSADACSSCVASDISVAWLSSRIDHTSIQFPRSRGDKAIIGTLWRG